METRANYIIVGIFTLVAFAGAFAFIWWVAQYNQGSDRVRLDVLIEGSASGLQPGSAVRYNGIRVGLVRRIYLPSDRPNLVIAETLVDPSTPVSTTTHALLGLPDLTGVAYIDLEGRREVGVDLLAKAREEGAIATIKADPSAISTLLASAQNILSRADSSMTEFEGFVKDARGPVYETVENVKTFSGALKDNAAGIDQFLEGATDLGRALTDISGKLDGTLKSAEALLNSVEPERVSQIVRNVEQVTADVRNASGKLDKVIETTTTVADDLKAFSGRANETLTRVDTLVASVSPDQIRSTVENVNGATESARTALADIAKLTDTLSGRTQDIDSIIASAKSVAEGVDATTKQVQGVVARLDAFIGEGDGTKLLDEASRILKRADEIVAAASPEKVGATIDDASAAAQTARKAVEDIAKITETLGGRTGDVDQIITDVRSLASRLNTASEKFDGVIAQVDKVLGEAGGSQLFADASKLVRRADEILSGVSAEEINKSVRSFGEAADSAKTAMADIAKVTGPIGERSGEVGKIVDDIAQMSSRLNAASVRVDGVLEKVDKLLGSGEGGALIAQAEDTLKTFQQVALNLDRRLAEISSGLSRFTGQGLREVEGLVRDSRNAVTRIERAVSDLERNPQRLIFGGESDVKTYNGGRQRR